MSGNGYPRFLCELLANCPRAKQGVHPWLFRVGRYLHKFHTPDQICAILAARTSDCGRHVERHEIIDAVKNSGACAWEPSRKSVSERRAKWLASPTSKCVPEFNPELALRAASRVSVDISPEWLKSHSPIPVSCSTEQYLESIFEPDEHALIFNRYKSQGRLWAPGESLDSFIRQHWPKGAWFLCNPIDGHYHWNPRMLKDSRRSKESVTSFRHAVLECDQEPREKWRPVWLKILVQLKLPIISITDSGGISDHAIVRVECESKQAWDQFKSETLQTLISLGADDGALTAVRLTRLPGCYRGERRQELLFLNPSADGTPIFQQNDFR